MTSSAWVSWIITCDCQPSDVDAISRLATEMADHFRSHEPDTTHFEFSVSADRSKLHLHERYANSAQALAHMKAFGDSFASRFMALLKPASVVVYGNPTPELRAGLEAMGPVFMESMAGFDRTSA